MHVSCVHATDPIGDPIAFSYTFTIDCTHVPVARKCADYTERSKHPRLLSTMLRALKQVLMLSFHVCRYASCRPSCPTPDCSEPGRKCVRSAASHPNITCIVAGKFDRKIREVSGQLVA